MNIAFRFIYLVLLKFNFVSQNPSTSKFKDKCVTLLTKFCIGFFPDDLYTLIYFLKKGTCFLYE